MILVHARPMTITSRGDADESIAFAFGMHATIFPAGVLCCGVVVLARSACGSCSTSSGKDKGAIHS